MKSIMLMLVILLSVKTFAAESSIEINIYTDRTAEVLAPVIDNYTKQTGNSINIITFKKFSELSRRLEGEGENTFADIIMVKDMVYLSSLASNGMFKPMESLALEEFVLPAMRHPENLWTAIAVRPRTIVYNKNLVSPEEISTYEDLASDHWKSKLCLRTSNSSYNVALVSSFIAYLGLENTENLLAGWMNNLAEKPFDSDSALLDSLAIGETCQVGVVNSYYLAAKLSKNASFPVGIAFANQNGRGVHVNGLGAGVSAYSQNTKAASEFIAFMLNEKSQNYFSSKDFSYQYPANKNIIPQTFVKDWGLYQAEEVNWSVLGGHNDKARLLFEKIGYK